MAIQIHLIDFYSTLCFWKCWIELSLLAHKKLNQKLCTFEFVMEMKSYQYFLVHSENEKKNKKSNICPLIALKLSLVLMMDWIILAFYDVLNFCSNFRENSLFGSLIASLFYSFCSCLGALVYIVCRRC